VESKPGGVNQQLRARGTEDEGLPAPMHPNPPAAVTAAASSGVEANAMGAATIGVVISAHLRQSGNLETEDYAH
jgi:hypothetical protein